MYAGSLLFDSSVHFDSNNTQCILFGSRPFRHGYRIVFHLNGKQNWYFQPWPNLGNMHNETQRFIRCYAEKNSLIGQIDHVVCDLRHLSPVVQIALTQ